MRELHVVAVSEDGRHIVLAGTKGATKGGFRVALDARLLAAVRGELPRPGEPEVRPSTLTPREIQDRLRAGESEEQIARSAGVPVDDLAEDLALSAPPENRDRIRDLVRAMAGLSVEHRQILLLISLEGLSYREVAETLDVPIGTVMSRLARARERLRCALEGDEDRAERRIK